MVFLHSDCPQSKKNLRNMEINKFKICVKIITNEKFTKKLS